MNATVNRLKTIEMLALAMGAAVASTGAQAASSCAPRSEIAKALGDSFHEQQGMYALSASGNLVELFVSKAGTWTLVVSTPRGVSCVLDAGEHMQVTFHPGADA
jgi:hypothetical protein